MTENENGAPLRCIVCARVSTEEQGKNGVSITNQLDEGRAKVKEIGGVLVGHCIEAGVSGALYHERDELQKALTEVENKRADALVFFDLSRMSRDIEFIQVIQRRVRIAGGKIVFVRAQYLENAHGFLQQGIEGVVNQFNRIQTTEVCIANRRKVAEAGRQPVRSISPYGFHIVNRHDVIKGSHRSDQLGHYEIIEDQAEIVRYIFNQYAAGESLRAIAIDLTAKGIPTPKERRGEARKTPEGEAMLYYEKPVWLPVTIRTIITNPVYKGFAEFGKTKRADDAEKAARGLVGKHAQIKTDPSKIVVIPCTPLLDKDPQKAADLWELCNQRRKEFKTLGAGRNDRKYLLTGLLRCPNCHRTLMIKRQQRRKKNGVTTRAYYCCSRACPGYSIDRSVCNPAHYKAEEIEAKVIETIAAAIARPKVLETAFRHYQTAKLAKFTEAEYDKLKADLNDVERRVSVVVKSQIEAQLKEIDASVYEETLRELSATRAVLRDRIAKFNDARQRAERAKPANKKAEFMTSLIADVREALTSPDVPAPDKNKMITRIIDVVYPIVPEDDNPKTPKNYSVRVSFRVGVFDPLARCIWNAGKWEIKEEG